jgi:catechol 2,3-dioxygenase-like lactoylglutathione lyase family enzyme
MRPALALALAFVACSAPQQLRPPTAAELESQPSSSPASPVAAPDRTPSLMSRTTILAVGDLPHSVQFYRGVFGWAPSIDTPAFVAFDLGGGSSLGLYAREGFAKNTGKAPEGLTYGAISGTELYLVFDDPSPFLERLKARGARVLSELSPRPWGDEAAYFADPDGNVLAVARRLPEPPPK